MPTQQVRIGARGSKLSLAQAGHMQRRIAAALGIHPSELFAEDSEAIKALQSKYEVRERLESRIREAIDEALKESS